MCMMHGTEMHKEPKITLNTFDQTMGVSHHGVS